MEDIIKGAEMTLGETLSPVAEFMALMYQMWESLPTSIQFLIGMALSVTVFFGLLNMLRG